VGVIMTIRAGSLCRLVAGLAGMVLVLRLLGLGLVFRPLLPRGGRTQSRGSVHANTDGVVALWQLLVDVGRGRQQRRRGPRARDEPHVCGRHVVDRVLSRDSEAAGTHQAGPCHDRQVRGCGAA
jgi:hypothetical protein